jgi:tetratricopeptide (TPR) repeat protein
MEKALEFDPTALVIMTDIGELYYFKREYDMAEAQLQKVLEIDPTFLNARHNLVKVRYKKGASYFLEDAGLRLFLQNLRKSEALSDNFDSRELERALAAKDEKTLRDLAMTAGLAAAKSNPSAHLSLARHYLLKGQKEKSIDSLEKAQQGKVFVMPFVAVDPLFDPLRSEPRFQDIIRKMNLAVR